MAACRRVIRHLWLMLALIPLPAWGGAEGAAFIYVTNSAGDSIHVIDPATNKVVQEIKGIEAAHGIAPSPDGARVYVSNEADSTLDVFDRSSGALIKKVPLSNHPNNIAVTKTGDRILVAIARGERRRRRRRREDVDADQEYPGQGSAAQHLRDARW